MVGTLPCTQTTGTCIYKSPLRLLSADARVGVGNADTEDLRPDCQPIVIYALLKDLDALLAAHVVGDLRSKGVVVPGVSEENVHQQQLNVAGVGDNKAAETVGHNVASLLVRAVTDLRHSNGALEATAHTVINTRGLAP